MKKRQYIILTVLGILITLIVFALAGGNGKKDKKNGNKAKAKTYVHTSAVLNADHSLQIKSNGRVNSSRDLMLIAEVQGKLLSTGIQFKNGSQFKSGQLLCKIDDTEAKLLMQARKSSFLTLLATALPDMKLDYPESFEKWEKFFQSVEVDKNLPDLPEISSVQEKTYLASRNILGEYYSIQADEEKLRRYLIYAPFDGSIVDAIAEEGTVVNPGGQIARIIKTGNLEIQVAIPVDEASKLNVGDAVQIYSKERKLDEPGKILRIGKYVNPNTQSVDVFVGMNKKEAEEIYDGMYVEVVIEAGQLNQVVQLPRKAIVNKEFIYSVVDSFLIKRPVQVHFTDDQFSYVAGIENGTDVVVEALSNPVDSMIVFKIE